MENSKPSIFIIDGYTIDLNQQSEEQIAQFVADLKLNDIQSDSDIFAELITLIEDSIQEYLPKSKDVINGLTIKDTIENLKKIKTDSIDFSLLTKITKAITSLTKELKKINLDELLKELEERRKQIAQLDTNTDYITAIENYKEYLEQYTNYTQDQIIEIIKEEANQLWGYDYTDYIQTEELEEEFIK